MDPDLLALAQAFGIDPSSLPIGGAAADDDDPPVFIGIQPRKNTGSPADFRNAESGSKRKFTEPVTRPLTQINSDFYRLTDAQLRDFQAKAVAAGRLSHPRFGDYDESTYKAWADVNEVAARFHAVGRDLTPSDVLDMASLGGTDDTDVEPGRASQISSELDLEGTVQAAAFKRLGRKLRKSEAATFIKVYQGIERQANGAVNAAQDTAKAGGDTTVTAPPDPSVAAQQYIDSHMAQEAAGQDTLGYFDALAGLIGGSR